MSLERSIAGKYKVGHKGRDKIDPSLTIGCIYETQGDYAMLIGFEGDLALVQLKSGQIQKVEKKSLKIVAP